MLGMIIGNASVIAMIGIGQGAQKLAAEQFESLGPNVLFVVPGSRAARDTTFDLPKTLVLEDAEAIASQVPTVTEVAPQINSRQVISYRNQNMDALVIGVTPKFLTVRSFDVAQGRFFSEIDLKRNNRVAVIGPEIAERFFGKQVALGKSVRLKNITVKIIGVMKEKGSFLGNNQDETVYLPLTTMANQIVGRTSPYGTEVSFISISAQNEVSIGAAKFQIANLLRLRHKIIGEDDFHVQTQKDILEIVGTITGGLTAMLAAIAAISLLVGGIGVMNIMLVSVTERTQEIGLRKAIGARERDILIQFLIEAVILAGVGGLLGMAIGISLVITIGIFTPLSTTVSTGAVILAVGVSGGIGLFFGVFPARQAAKLDPIVALRSA
jgi:putative ABC transport system permease protein